MTSDYGDSIECLRPDGYRYFEQLKEHLGGSLGKIFDGELVYPRQLEIHLPSDGVKRCNFNCYWCQGNLLDRSLVRYEEELFKLLEQLKDKNIHYVVQGGNYSESLFSPYALDLVRVAKQDLKANYGIHTNGSLLLGLEKTQSFMSELNKLATSKEDYLSISLDAGTAESHMKGHGLSVNWFDAIIEGIKTMSQIRGSSPFPAIRICYLLNDYNSSQKELEGIVCMANELNVDSVKFSIPYDLYGKDFDTVRKYKGRIEVKKDREYKERLLPLIDASGKRTQVFYLSPYTQDVDRMNFKQCIYGYFQITAGADGHWYRCSSMASPTFKFNRLGKITGNLEEWHQSIMLNQSPSFDPSRCFKAGGRCNRMALECNKEWEALNV